MGKKNDEEKVWEGRENPISRVVSFNMIERTGDWGGQGSPPPPPLLTLLDKLLDIKLNLGWPSWLEIESIGTVTLQ